MLSCVTHWTALVLSWVGAPGKFVISVELALVFPPFVWMYAVGPEGEQKCTILISRDRNSEDMVPARHCFWLSFGFC